MSATSIAAGHAQGARLFPGVLACIVVAAAATFLSQHYAAPVMLFALLLGMAMNFLSADGPCAPGIEFTAKQVLRVGVALLGLRITVAQVAALGWEPVVLVVVSIALTIALSMLVARAMGFNTPVRFPERRRDGDLRRFRGIGARGGVALASAEGAGHAVHGRHRVRAVDRGDDRLPDAGPCARPRSARRPASSSARPSTTSPRSSAPAIASRRRAATWRPWSS